MRISTLFKSFIVFAVISTYLMVAVPSRTVVVRNLELAKKSISLDKRYGNEYVNNVFRDNIILTLAYMEGRVKKQSDINWQEIGKPFYYEFTLRPGEVFAFHEYVFSKYKDKRIVTTNAHFSASEGFLSDGYLVGDGVCHLASLIKWVAVDAGLSVTAPTNHDFANIPEVPREYGVSIYTMPDQVGASAMQNLYVENILEKPVKFAFNYKKGILSLSILKFN